MTDEPQPSPSSPDPEQRRDSTLPLPTEPLPPWGQASVPTGPYGGEPALVAKPEPIITPDVAPVSPAPAWASPISPANLPVPVFAPTPNPSPGYPPPSMTSPAGPPPGGLPVPVQPQHQPILVRLGEVAVSSTTIYTPAGEIPLRGSHWMVADQWQVRQKIAPWAVVVSIVLCVALLAAACLVLFTACLAPFAFLFLLAKESTYDGVIQITITNGNRQYVARLPAANQAQVHSVHSQVNYVRSLATL